MRIKFSVIMLMTILAIVACDSKERVKAPAKAKAPQDMGQAITDGHVVEVKEAIHANSYTYLRVVEGEQEYWIATAKQPIEAGQVVSYAKGLEMKDFESKELGRTFESIWFVGEMRGKSSAASSMSQSKKPVAPVADISVEKVDGGVSIQELYSDMKDLEGKVVLVKGQVTKFNSGIMGRNWVHLQDGTTQGDYFDVTITTKASVEVGDVVVFSGQVTLNKDFGAGYKYDLIIEEAEVSAES